MPVYHRLAGAEQVMYKLLLVVLLASTARAWSQKLPTVSTPSGKLQGTIESCGTFCTFYSFKGIPYALPPVGNLRFRNPVPHPGWSGVCDASQHGDICPQIDKLSGTMVGEEDCLLLNIYSPQIIGKHPVMVWIHGGAFRFGSGNSDQLGPQKLIREGVVLVTINYRLGALGFLSTGDKYAQGNWGLKDCVEALRWVQANIGAFGGDPNNVTIFGQSAGGSMVHYLYLSDMATGLFHKAIAQSGTALAPAMFQPNPRLNAGKMANNFGFSNDSYMYVDQLRTVPASSFVSFQESHHKAAIPRFRQPYDFAPSVEHATSPEPKALTDKPIKLIKIRNNEIPLMLGYTDLEGAFYAAQDFASVGTVWKQFNSNPHLLVPFFWNIDQGSPASAAVSSALRQSYFRGENIGFPDSFKWDQYYGDHAILFTTDVTMRLHATASAQLHYYQFSYDGQLNLSKKMLRIVQPGAVHSDELPYLFESAAAVQADVSPGSHALKVSDRMVRMWTNFAKYGHPTPAEDSLLQNITWSSIQEGNVTQLVIGHNLVVQNGANLERLQLWHELQDRYSKSPFQ